MVIGVILQIEDPKMWLVVRGAIAAAQRTKTTLVFYASPIEEGFVQLDPGTFTRIFSFQEARHDGLMLVFAGHPLVDYAEDAWKRGKPTMLVARRKGEVPFVANNNRESVRGMVRRLADKGHSEIAFLSGLSHNFAGDERLEGYREGLLECGLPFKPELVMQGDYLEGKGREAVAEALARGLEFTALLAANDLSALGAMAALHEAGLGPGADVEVAGFDNIPRAHWSTPPLSTFDTCLYQMGYQACFELSRLVVGHEYEGHVTVPARFVPRQSTWESVGVEERRQPLELDYVEQSFLYDTQLERVLLDEEGKWLTEELMAGLDAPESFLQALRELLGLVERLGLSAACLYPLIRDIGQGTDLSRAMSLLSSAYFDEQSRVADIATRYMTHTRGLRELSYMAADEALVLDTLHATLRNLGLKHAGVYLFNHASRRGEEMITPGQWRRWDLERCCEPGHFAPVQAGGFDPGWMDLREGHALWLVLPMLYDEQLSGMVVLDASGPFLVHFTDLVRRFSVSLRSARTQAALGRANAELVETSRMAGLAEMATGVLHNIGNALNSVNTSTTLALELARGSKAPGVGRAAQLLLEHRAELATFLTSDPRGRQLPEYLAQLGGHLQSERSRMQEELENLRAMIDHINDIVSAQQDYAKVSGLVEVLPVEDIVEFSLRLSEASLTRHMVTVRRDYGDAPPVKVHRQKLAQILINVIRNAKESMDEADPPEKILLIRIAAGRPGFVELEIADNGTGIPRERLHQIFSFGKTTKKGGHGFGLHNSALAAKEMGGTLSARSEGLGKGASFLIELPAGEGKR